jgi:hypothetical protein
MLTHHIVYFRAIVSAVCVHLVYVRALLETRQRLGQHGGVIRII